MSVISDIATVATAVGVLLAAAGLIAQARQRKFGLAQIYIQRYWDLDDLKRLDPGQNAHTISYLRLCEDEYEVARLGWIDSGVWRVWHDGIRAGIKYLDIPDTEYALIRRCHDQGSGHRAHKCQSLDGTPWLRRLNWWIERRLLLGHAKDPSGTGT